MPDSPSGGPAPYYAYILRFWPEQQAGGETVWRFILLDSQTGKRLGFASFEAFVAYLSQLTQDRRSPKDDSR
jgi:hypothetical protein